MRAPALRRHPAAEGSEKSSRHDTIAQGRDLSGDAYHDLLALRTGLRRFERWSAEQAEAAGLTPAQHQLLLAIRGHGYPPGPTIGEVADYLLLQHHSAVGLVDRAVDAGLVRRDRSEDDQRVVRLQLTPAGAERLAALSALHLEELRRLQLVVPETWRGLAPAHPPHGFPRRAPVDAAARSGGDVRIVRVREPVPSGPARRVLVDRLWPRGLAKADAPFEEWRKDVAPSTGLRQWYGHVPERFDEFSRRYREELDQAPAAQAVQELRDLAAGPGLVLMTATKDVDHSAAEVLRQVLR